MKRYSIYIVLVALLFLLMYWVNKDVPIQYQWKPSFHTKDKQPYGAYAFDALLKSSWKKGYTQNYLGIRAMESKEMLDKNNLLIIADDFDISEEEMEILLDYIKEGGNALLIANYFSDKIETVLRITTESDYSFRSILNLNEQQARCNIHFCSPALSAKVYSFPQTLCARYFTSFDEEEDSTRFSNAVISSIVGTSIDSMYVISETTDNKIVSLRYHIGKGNLILASNPLVYTNYGILNDSINGYIWKHLAYLQNRPLIRTEYYQIGSQGENEQSIFRYLLSERSLRWAYYLTLLTIIVFMLFTAKRKQKAIPIIKPPANKMLAFVRSIANLYLLKNNNADIVRKKYIYWADEIKRRYGIDIINENDDWNLYTRLAAKTGQPAPELRRLLIFLRIEEERILSDEEMMQLITKMNTIKNGRV